MPVVASYRGVFPYFEATSRVLVVGTYSCVVFRALLRAPNVVGCGVELAR
jgi:hypothetical protein